MASPDLSSALKFTPAAVKSTYSFGGSKVHEIQLQLDPVGQGLHELQLELSSAHIAVPSDAAASQYELEALREQARPFVEQMAFGSLSAATN
jgi:hypothetical protein